MSTFESNLKGLLNFQKNMKQMDSSYYTDVGIFKPEVYEDSGKTVPEVGLEHELGVISKNLPRRSFLEDPIRDNMNKIIKGLSTTIGKKLVESNMDEIFQAIGEGAEKVVQRGFRTKGYGKWSPLSSVTVANKAVKAIKIRDYKRITKAVTRSQVRKARDSILIDTELLKNSIEWRVGKS